MKHILITIAAALLALAFTHAAFGQEAPAAPSITQRAQALSAGYAAAKAGQRTSGALVRALSAFVLANADEINAVAADIANIEATEVRSDIAMIKGDLDNGVTLYGTWTLSVPLQQQYNPSQYLRRCAPLAEVQAYAAQSNCRLPVLHIATQRLNRQDILFGAYAAKVATGEIDPGYRKWYLGTLQALTPAAAINSLNAEIRYAMAKAPEGAARTQWLAELNMQRALLQGMQ